MNASMIGRNIKRLREEKKITQQQLADALGITYQAVSKWECGTTLPDVTILPLIAEYFCVSIDSLFMENRL
ncbi:MAG: helix-turn-helix transcriptional regulator [Papillibacter sp.]|jgi:transcriptional regulator with XRE-family HTH domain|nr:helix-turn-helix transcriptional regulator [Papillibacter sp.]